MSTQRRTCIQIEYITIKYCKAKTLKEINVNNKMKFDIQVVFAGGWEIKIFSTVFRDLGKYMLGKLYLQRQTVPVITEKTNDKLGFEVRYLDIFFKKLYFAFNFFQVFGALLKSQNVIL